MVIIETSGMYQVYDDDSVTAHEKLPAGVYTVVFNKMIGTYLVPKYNVQNKEKMYGKLPAKMDKALNAFKRSSRNFGVALAGKKGLGKTMWATKMIERCVEEGYPVIVVDSYIHNLTSFIESINQEAVVMFDEFDKVFYDRENQTAAQDILLPMFDGITMSKKFFILTYNEESKVSKYLINRPGRIKYMFRVTAPDKETIEEYLFDTIENKEENIDSLAQKLAPFKLSFDSLRAIVEELNEGYSLSETLEDLNIDMESNNGDENDYTIKITFSDGEVITTNSYLNIMKPINSYLWISDKKYNIGIGKIQFTNAKVAFTEKGIIIPAHMAKYVPFFDEDEIGEKDYFTKEEVEAYKKKTVIGINIYNNELTKSYSIADFVTAAI